MNEILQKRIEEAAKKAKTDFLNRFNWSGNQETGFKQGAIWMLNNQWISVVEALPTEKVIIAKLSNDFCGKDDCYEILHRIAKEHIDLKHPNGYYDSCGENVPTNAITHWAEIPSLKGETK